MAIVAESREVRSPPSAHLGEYLGRLDSCTTEGIYAHRLEELLCGSGWLTPRDLNCFLEGCELAAAYAETLALYADELFDGEEYPAAEMRALAAHIEREAAHRCPGFALVVWERCGELPGLTGLIRKIAWNRLSPSAAWLLLRLLTDVWRYDAPEKVWGAKWRFLRREFPRIVERVHAVPIDRQEKLIDALGCFLGRWDKVGELECRWPAACSIAARLASPPFSDEALGTDVLGCLMDTLPTALSARLLAAPDRCFLTLEEEVDRGIFGNQRMEDGIATLSRRVPELVADAFLRHPRTLLKTAKVLGTLSEPERHRVLEVFAEHPMNDPVLLSRPLPDVCELLARHAHSGANPVPRRLREFVEQGRALTPGQIERHRRVISERLLRVRLELLADVAVEAMGRGLLLDRRHAALRHALQMLRGSDGNRRGLRKLLKAIADGKPPAEYLLGHPATQAWLRRHPRVDAAKWTRGIELTVQVAGLGRLDLAVEQDPLEALRLGTYVGTCLGLGQVCAYSAAAVVLDLNKRVVYARNAHGRVVARQLVAISEADELVCFQVYPEAASDALQGAFLDFDLRFADALDLSVHEDALPGTPEIAHILSQEWWDDGVWDVFCR